MACVERCLVFLGDSFVNGHGDPGCLGWVGRVCTWARERGVPLTVYNLAVRGATSVEVVRRWRDEARPRLHDDLDGRIVASFGLNDLWLGAPLAQPLASLETLIAECQGRWPLLVVGPPPVAEPELADPVALLDAAYARRCVHAGVPYVAVHDALQQSGVWEAEAARGDGAHPGAGGYADLARVVDAAPEWRRWLEEEDR